MKAKKEIADSPLRIRATALFLAPSVVGTILTAFLNYPYNWYLGFGIALVIGIIASKFLIKHGAGLVILGTLTALISSQFILQGFYVLLPAIEITPATVLKNGFPKWRPLHVTGYLIPEYGVRSETKEVTYFSLFNILYDRQPGESLSHYSNRRFETQMRFNRTLQSIELKERGDHVLGLESSGIFAACICDDTWTNIKGDNFYLVQHQDALVAFASLNQDSQQQVVAEQIIGEPYASLIWPRLLVLILGFGLPIFGAYSLYRYGEYQLPNGKDGK